jgi:hypothetical protein
MQKKRKKSRTTQVQASLLPPFHPFSCFLQLATLRDSVSGASAAFVASAALSTLFETRMHNLLRDLESESTLVSVCWPPTFNLAHSSVLGGLSLITLLL